MWCPSCAYHVLFQHDTAEIVGAAMKAYLGGLLAYGKPGCLNIFYVGKHDAAHGYHADIFIGGGEVMNAADAGKQGINVLEGPGNKGQKAFGAFWLKALHMPDLYQVFKAFFQSFYMAKHHGGRSSDIELMGF